MATYGGERDLFIRGLRLWRDVFSATPLANLAADDARLAFRRGTLVFGGGLLLFVTGWVLAVFTAANA